jgi:hypothetical protein
MEQDIRLGQDWDSKVLSPILCGEFQFVDKDLHFAGAQDLCEIRSQETTFKVRVSSQIGERPFIIETLDGCDISVLMHERGCRSQASFACTGQAQSTNRHIRLN